VRSWLFFLSGITWNHINRLKSADIMYKMRYTSHRSVDYKHVGFSCS